MQGTMVRRAMPPDSLRDRPAFDFIGDNRYPTLISGKMWKAMQRQPLPGGLTLHPTLTRLSRIDSDLPTMPGLD